MIVAEKIQQIIHALEVGQFARRLQLLVLALAVLGLALMYDLFAYRSFSAPEAMDAAQVARNLAEGRGYTTDFIRPFSVFLISKHNFAAPGQKVQATNTLNFAQVNSPHPDLANPPIYPVLLASLFKCWQPDWKAETDKPFWSGGGWFMRYAPEFVITIINQLLFFEAVIMTFFITRELLVGPSPGWPRF